MDSDTRNLLAALAAILGVATALVSVFAGWPLLMALAALLGGVAALGSSIPRKQSEAQECQVRLASPAARHWKWYRLERAPETPGGRRSA